MAGWKFDRTAGHLALDFANTVSNRHAPPAIERLGSYGELVEFARQTGLVLEAEARRLAQLGEQRPDVADGVLAEAVALRDALFRIFEAVATEATPRASDIAVLNAHHARFRLDERFRWEWSARPDGLDAFVGPVVRAAIDLLTSDQRQRIRRCADDSCLWIFLDTSKNRSRRWCDMAQCGNRAKARRFHERHQAGE
jgi:predicted RNA-binding Zn ribbon-like protein